MFAILLSQGRNTTLSLSVEACSTFVIDSQDCLDTSMMLTQWFSSCGRQNYMGLPSTSQIV